MDAYAQLVAEGYLRGQAGAGTRVAETAALSEPLAAPARPAPSASGPAIRFDFNPNLPDLASFPRRAWSISAARALRDAPDALLGYGDPRGVVELRSSLADYLGRVRGVFADPDSIVISTGARQGLFLTSRALGDRGAERVAVEDPGWLAQREAVAAAGLEPVPVPVDEFGLRVDALDDADTDAVVVSPAHQFPTGVVLAPERRAALVDWANRTGGVIIEDDYDGEYRYDHAPVGAVQGLAPESVVYLGSASKTIAPALRLGWLVLPKALAPAVAGDKERADRGSAVLDQLTLADFLAHGHLERHLRRMRLRYRRRRDALVAALHRHLPDARVTGIAAGLRAVARLPEDWSEEAVVETALERGVSVTGLSAYVVARRDEGPALVLGYANLSEPAIDRGIATLAEAIAVRGLRLERRRAG